MHEENLVLSRIQSKTPSVFPLSISPKIIDFNQKLRNENLDFGFFCKKVFGGIWVEKYSD
ncbi:hypothetical protein C943_01172 [Mariniradius saccharolyticus AK6]|uniref:Uncharacterized protein n=1 Tax=Mariniradius saccharolyticus AK6 TaxID=1239962 RepID=M7X4T3_9BACT|nr:hypothetical protein C943_01172 [Mariniradius saccharolyticus AK6]